MNVFVRFSALPLAVVVMWLLINQSLAPGHIVLGALLAIPVTWFTRRLRPLRARPRKLWVGVKLLGIVLRDIIQSNINVGIIILGASRRQPNIEFIDIPLELRNPHGLGVLSMIITATPGTVWSGYDRENNILRLHILDLQDTQFWVDTIKGHYERPLMEMFE